MRIGDKGFVVFNAGGVGEEVADENMLTDGCGKFWEPVADRVVEGETLVFFQEEDGHGGELFCDGGHAEVRGGVDGGFGGQVGEAGGVSIEDIAVLFDGEGDAGLVGREGMEKGVEAGG